MNLLRLFSAPILLLAVLSLYGCATPTPPKTHTETGICQTAKVKLDTDFPTGNVANCKAVTEKHFSLSITPEDAPPINCSAWYAFRLTPRNARKTVGRVTISLGYEICGHRYWPKTSSDGTVWTSVPEDDVEITEVDGIKQARFSVRLDKDALFVAAQEIFPPITYETWLRRIGQSANARIWSLGKSAEQRDIPAMTIKKNGHQPREQIVLIGRQHPPEVTGALAMLPFVETLLADTPLAKRYRARFETIVIPMLNPDGVTRGHWRHNIGGTDLNRDWGPFAQPETKLMDSLLKKIAANPGKKLRFFADFHSTWKDVFYSIPDEHPTNPPLFTKLWLERLQERMPDYKVTRDQNHNASSTVSKAYIYETYGVPAVTFELGDKTDRELIKRIGREAATAMMETLLETEPPS